MATKITPAWANSGTKTKPADAKIEQGWVAGEQPPHEWENERMNTRDETINDIIDDHDNLITQLQSTSLLGDGAGYIGLREISGSPDNIATSDVRTGIANTLFYTNQRARIASDEEITGDWGFTGNPSLMAGQIGLKDEQHIDKYACINSYSETDDRYGIVHPFQGQTLKTIGTTHTDPCAIVDPAKPGNYLVVLVESDGTDLHTVDPVTLATTTTAITGLAAGVVEITSACSDGENVYVTIRRGVGTQDTIAKITVSTGAMAWESNAATTDAFRGFPYDRIIAGDPITTSPWVVSLYVVSGNLTMNTLKVIQKRDSSTGINLWSSSASLSTKKPTGGLAQNGSLVGVTTDASDSTVAKLAFFDTSTGTDTGSYFDMATSGTSSSDYSYDLVYDGRRWAWLSAGGAYRFLRAAKADYWATTDQIDNSNPLQFDGFSLVFDGVNIWGVSPDNSNYVMNLYKIHSAKDQSSSEVYPSIIRDLTASFNPFSPDWNIGRGCRVGPHVVFSTGEPGSPSNRNTIFVIRNSSTWT